jgi:hypothetical protein
VPDVAAGAWLTNLAGFATPAAASRDAGEEDCPPALMPARPDGKAVLNQIGLNGKIVTADALQAVKATVTPIHERRVRAPVKENRRAPSLAVYAVSVSRIVPLVSCS